MLQTIIFFVGDVLFEDDFIQIMTGVVGSNWNNILHLVIDGLGLGSVNSLIVSFLFFLIKVEPRT